MHVCYLSFYSSGIQVRLSCFGSGKAAVSLQDLPGEDFASKIIYAVVRMHFLASLSDRCGEGMDCRA